MDDRPGWRHTQLARVRAWLRSRVGESEPAPDDLNAALDSMLMLVESALAERTASEQRMRHVLADAAHELRTPLTSIQGFAELYRRGGVPPGPELDEAMLRIEAEVARMRVLVDDLLLLAHLDEERPLDSRPVDLLAVAADSVRDAHLRAPQRTIHLTSLDEAADTFPQTTVLGDETRLRQVASNLINNAIQHTPDHARITVRVDSMPSPPGQIDEGLPVVTSVGPPMPAAEPVAILEVTDTGPGIPPYHAGRVFDRLYRADPSRSRAKGGAGLGLSIVAAIVAAHSGRIELATGHGAGSTFRVLLPVPPSR